MIIITDKNFIMNSSNSYIDNENTSEILDPKETYKKNEYLLLLA